MNIAVIGAGYVGLVTAAGLASLGHRVRVGETDPKRVTLLNSGGVPLHEKDLPDLLSEGLGSGRLTFHVDNKEAVTDAEVVVIALPTPSSNDDSANLTFIYDALAGIADTLGDESVVVIKSTVPIGSAEEFSALLQDLGAHVPVVSNPEFLAEGSAVKNFLCPDRIIIGADDTRAAELVEEMYGSINSPVIVTDTRSAEMIKYAANAYLATRLTFINTIANVCEQVGADVNEVRVGIGADRRIGTHFMQPGPGYGGSCFPKDTRALVHIAKDAEYDFAFLQSVIDGNDAQMARIAKKVLTATKGIKRPHVGMWGIAFKAGTDDTRESPAVAIAKQLMASGLTVAAYDPEVTLAPSEVKGITIAASAIDATRGADVLLIATEWSEFADEDIEAVNGVMRGSSIVDARNMLDRDMVEGLGMSYSGVGR